MNDIVFILFTYPFIGMFIGIFFWLLVAIRIVKIRGWENFPHFHKSVVMISNHQTLWDWFILIGLCFHQYVFHPFKFSPYTMADKNNYTNKRRYALVRSRLIPVDRENLSKVKGRMAITDAIEQSLVLAKKVLEKGGWLIIWPEGGRTKSGNYWIRSKGGEIRPLKSEFAVLASGTAALVLPIWINWSWLEIKVTIGKPRSFTGKPTKEIVVETEKVLLELADKVA